MEVCWNYSIMDIVSLSDSEKKVFSIRRIKLIEKNRFCVDESRLNTLLLSKMFNKK